MPKLKLTKRHIDALVPGAGREHFWDTEVSGFGLRITPAGERIYVVKYRAGDRQRWIQIGRHGSPWTPDAARSEAIRILGDVSRGLDPGGARKSARVAMTFSELCDLYFAEGVANKKPSTLRSDRTRARLHLVPLLGSKRVEVLTRDDIEQMRAAVESGRSIARGPEKRGPGSVAKGGPGAAAQCVEASTSRRFGRSSAFFRPRSSGASPTRCRRDRADECCARGRGNSAARVHRLPTRRDRHPEMGGSRPRTPFPEFARFEDRQEDRPPERTCGRNT